MKTMFQQSFEIDADVVTLREIKKIFEYVGTLNKTKFKKHRRETVYLDDVSYCHDLERRTVILFLKFMVCRRPFLSIDGRKITLYEVRDFKKLLRTLTKLEQEK